MTVSRFKAAVGNLVDQQTTHVYVDDGKQRLESDDDDQKHLCRRHNPSLALPPALGPVPVAAAATRLTPSKQSPTEHIPEL